MMHKKVYSMDSHLIALSLGEFLSLATCWEFFRVDVVSGEVSA